MLSEFMSQKVVSQSHTQTIVSDSCETSNGIEWIEAISIRSMDENKCSSSGLGTESMVRAGDWDGSGKGLEGSERH